MLSPIPLLAFHCLNPVGFLFSFSAKRRMQMLCPNYADEIPWSVLPMQYATIMPQHVIDRLCTIDLDVNFLYECKQQVMQV